MVRATPHGPWAALAIIQTRFWHCAPPARELDATVRAEIGDALT
jgi:hypothetical protein